MTGSGRERPGSSWDIPVNSEAHCQRRLSLEPDISRLIAVWLDEDGDPFVHWDLHLAEPIPSPMSASSNARRPSLPILSTPRKCWATRSTEASVVPALHERFERRFSPDVRLERCRTAGELRHHVSGAALCNRTEASAADGHINRFPWRGGAGLQVYGRHRAFGSLRVAGDLKNAH